jgi:cyclophilin family peptidyl-prolyl cis-trans isomerase/FKBP-type peptidyl-prolyl cis-trans isomerase
LSRRLLATSIAAAISLTACGGSDGTPVADPVGDNGNESAEPDDTTAAATDITDTSDAPESALGQLIAGNPDTGKPDVQLPDELSDDLVVNDLVEGDGLEIEVGDTATVHYIGLLTETGSEFDNSYDRAQPFPVTVGVGQVIPGWDQGLLGARVGTTRQLEIPAELGYGDTGAGGVIPPGSALTFVVEVVAVDKPMQLGEMADPSECPAADGSSEPRTELDEYPPACIDITKNYSAEIVTNFGTVVVELDPERAPLAVNSFVVLARYHYFDGTTCHRAIPSFVVQCGDPTATGRGGPGYRFDDELPEAGEYSIGSIAMANSGPNTNGSQFFIITGDRGAALPPSYSLFAEVTDGLDTTVVDLDAAANPNDNGVPPLETITIESITIIES